MNAEGTCPICKIPLTVNSDHNQVQFCQTPAEENFIQLKMMKMNDCSIMILKLFQKIMMVLSYYARKPTKKRIMRQY